MDDPRYSTYSAITDRPRLQWPGNARVALWVAPNVEFYEYEPPPSTFRNAWSRMPHPDVLHYSYRDYGNRVGFWRMLEVFDHHRVRASVSLNMAVLEHFPEIRDAMVARNWDYITHGIYNTRYLFGLTPGEERAFYQDNIDTLYRHDRLYADGAVTGRLLVLNLHPTRIGQPFRIKYLDLALGHITRHEGVWAATGREIVDWYLNQTV